VRRGARALLGEEDDGVGHLARVGERGGIDSGPAASGVGQVLVDVVGAAGARRSY
jgi:hypothetical protein